MVMGWLRPAILLPAGAVTGLSSAQLEAIIAHELAHIRRHDYVINLAQTIVETLLFYHPAVWWLSNRIRLEREHCCDDAAVAVCGDAAGYARALTELEGLRGPRPAVASVNGSLLTRVQRILGVSEPRRHRVPSGFAAVFALGGLVLAATALGLSAHGSSEGDGKVTDPSLERLIQGMEARGELVRRELRSIRGFYVIRKTAREGDGETAPVRVDDQAEQKEESPRPRVGIVVPRWEAENDFTGTVLIESVIHEHSAWVEGRYRNSRRTASPEDKASGTMYGCDGKNYWSYSPKSGSSSREFVLREECEGRLVGGAGSSLARELGLSRWVDVDSDLGVPRHLWVIRSGNPRLIGEDTVNGLTCQVIEYDELDVKGFERLWVCPALGHAVVRAEGEATGYKNFPASVYLRHSWDYSGFREVLEGLWTPTVVARKGERQDANGNWVLTGSTELEVVLLEVNESVPEEELLPPPHGGTDVLADEKWQWWAWVGGAGSRSRIDAFASEILARIQRKGKPEEEAAAPTDDEAPAAEAKRAGEYVLFTAPHLYTWRGGASEGEAERTEEAFLIFISATPDGRPLSPELSEVREHGLRVIAPDERYRVSGEDLQVLLEWLKENAVAGDSRADTMEIEAQGLDVEHVMQAVSRSTGAIIVLRRGVEGPITLKANLPANAEVLLDTICEAKGWHWSRHETGAYIVSTKPKAGGAETDATSETAGDRVSRMYQLQYMPPIYIAYVLGYSDDPGPMWFRSDLDDVGSATMPGGPGAGSGDGGDLQGKGALAMFVPEGIDAVVAFSPLNALLIRGTEESINELIELIKLVDRKPQQVILDIFGFRGLPVGTHESDFFQGESEHGGAVRGPFLGFVPDATPSAEAPCRAERVASMNLMPAVTTAGANTLLLAITPRINGDGTITLRAEVRQADREMMTENDFKAGAAAARSLASAVVNVKDGEVVGFVSHCEGSWHTLIVKPRIVSETDGED
jgi:hypothetical protein